MDFSSLVMTFVPLFVVLDALGNLPFVITLSNGMSAVERRGMVHVAVVGATLVGLLFLFFGQFIIVALGISVGAFAIAGGIILLILSINYMNSDRMMEMGENDGIAIVPIGTPLLVGPATITTLLLLATQYPLGIVLLSFFLNMAISWTIFQTSDYVIRIVGRGGLKALSKVFDLLLAAIAVNMIIKGLGMVGVFTLAG